MSSKPLPPRTNASFNDNGAPLANPLPITLPSSPESQVPDFNEFKLDPLQNAGPSPHRLREARRSFVLHLEPCTNTALYTSLIKFQERSLSQCGPNQAHSTTPHVSVLGRVSIDRGAQSQWGSVDKLCKIVDSEIGAVRAQLQPPLFAGYEITQKPARSLVMRLSTQVTYTRLARSIVRQMAHEQDVSLQQVPPMDRLYLGYQILKSLPSATAQDLLAIAKETIDVEDWVLKGGSWQLALYEVLLESRVMGVQQQVSLIKSWQIPRHTSVSAPSPWLPTSVRIKLALLNTRYFNHTKTDNAGEEYRERH